jgi:hypothetical protein
MASDDDDYLGIPSTKVILVPTAVQGSREPRTRENDLGSRTMPCPCAHKPHGVQHIILQHAGASPRRNVAHRAGSLGKQKNFLVKGGGRALDLAAEEALATFGTSAIRVSISSSVSPCSTLQHWGVTAGCSLLQDLKAANSTLANELLRLQTNGSEVSSNLDQPIITCSPRVQSACSPCQPAALHRVHVRLFLRGGFLPMHRLSLMPPPQ